MGTGFVTIHHGQERFSGGGEIMMRIHTVPGGKSGVARTRTIALSVVVALAALTLPIATATMAEKAVPPSQGQQLSARLIPVNVAPLETRGAIMG
jgi:hypothetical protein